jgi:transposase-like protein
VAVGSIPAAADKLGCNLRWRAKWPKAADEIRDDLDRLLTFYDVPAERWLNLKTSNPLSVGSTFATVRLRTLVRSRRGCTDATRPSQTRIA